MRRLVLVLVLWGCDDGGGGPAADLGADGGDAVADVAVDAEVESCILDGDCAAGEYCATSAESAEGRCEPGCRTRPDTCEADDAHFLCDDVTRGCVLKPCEVDDDCPGALLCLESACVERDAFGCRPGLGDCGEDAACDPDTLACAAHAVCCGRRGCEMAAPFECEGQTLPERSSCAPDPCTTPCDGHADCGIEQYCDDAEGRCRFGCRAGLQGACADDLACDEATRVCELRACAEDGDCETWQFCGAAGDCQDGCRLEPDNCDLPARCDERRSCRVFCRLDEDCADGEYCDAGFAQCAPFCDPASHAPCGPGSRCDAESLRCAPGCADDPAELEGGDDTPETAVPARFEVVHGGAAVELAGRVVCPGDADVVSLQVGPAQRAQVSLVYDPADGQLGLRLLGPAGELLGEDLGPGAPKRLRAPPFRAEAAEGVWVAEVVGLGIGHAVPYRLDLLRSEPGQGCLVDPRDPGDGDPEGAAQAGLRRQRDFADPYRGDLCPAGDEDWYCFPMADDDGLAVTVVAPPGCGPVEGDLFPSTQLAAEGPVDPAGSLGAGRMVADGTAYSFEGLPDSGAFSTELWCLRVRAADGEVCEDYDVTLAFRRRGVFCSDQAEPNDGLGEAVVLDGDGPLADAEGRLPENVDLRVPLNLEVCEGDADLFTFQTDANDAVRAWLVSEDARGELRVGFLDGQGQPRGDFARHGTPEGMPQQALAINADGGRMYVRVRGVDASTGTYQLFLRREPTAGLCAQDLQEPVDRRNDSALAASSLRVVAEGRQSLANASLCNPDDERDEDWYAFEVERDGSRICATASFRHRSGNVDLQLFRAGILGSPCARTQDCDGGAACVDGRCQAPIGQGTTRNDNEFVELPKASVQAGDHFLRVFSPDGDQNQYDLTLTVVPPRAQGCDPDWREAEGENDDIRAASALGSGRVAVCDAWICHGERGAGDWYEVVVPPGADRTVHVAFEPRADGVLLLSLVDPEAGVGGVVESLELQTSAQCINIAGGQSARTLFFAITADAVVEDGDQRVDYTLQVVPTDLSGNRRGECDRLNGGLFDYIQWPTMDL